MKPLVRTLVAAVAGLAAANDATALTYGEAEFTCPIGGEVFVARTVTSSTQVGIRLDLKPVGALEAPLPLPVCPSNGFVMYKSSFSKEEFEKLTAIVESDAYREARKQNSSYFMLAHLIEHTEPDDLELGHIYLKACWEAEAERPRRLRSYQNLALKKFKAYLGSHSEHSEDWWIAQIAAANLERRTGRHDEAIARIDALLLDEGEAGKAYGAFLGQIRQWAERRNMEPQEFKRE